MALAPCTTFAIWSNNFHSTSLFPPDRQIFFYFFFVFFSFSSLFLHLHFNRTIFLCSPVLLLVFVIILMSSWNTHNNCLFNLLRVFSISDRHTRFLSQRIHGAYTPLAYEYFCNGRISCDLSSFLYQIELLCIFFNCTVWITRNVYPLQLLFVHRNFGFLFFKLYFFIFLFGKTNFIIYEPCMCVDKVFSFFLLIAMLKLFLLFESCIHFCWPSTILISFGFHNFSFNVESKPGRNHWKIMCLMRKERSSWTQWVFDILFAVWFN